MEGSRFDAWVRMWGTPWRRGVLRLGALGGIGGLIAGLGHEEAAAKCVRPGKKCKKKNGKKKKCCGGAKCRGKKCRCTNGGLACGKNCCLPDQVCLPDGGVLTCTDPIAVGGVCDPAQPEACVSGVCGCGPGACTCREENCVPPGGTCNSNQACCDSLCYGLQGFICGPLP